MGPLGNVSPAAPAPGFRGASASVLGAVASDAALRAELALDVTDRPAASVHSRSAPQTITASVR